MPLLVAALHLVSVASAEPRLSAPAAPLDAGAAVPLTFAPDARGAMIDGCAAVELERREGEHWSPVEGGAACDGSTPARRVAEKLTLSVATPGPGEYRAVVAWGTGCVEGRPFALAACTTTGVARSEAFVVAPPSGGAQRSLAQIGRGATAL